MLTTYQEISEFYKIREEVGINYSLERMEALMKEMNDPAAKLPVIHIAGTNGKGSTGAYLHSSLREAGYSTGTYISPVIGEMHEQIVYNGTPISREEFVTLCQAVEPFILKVEEDRGELISTFECLTASMYYYFAHIQEVDYLIVEAGMGGRLDATNVVKKPLASLVTNISLDHVNYLGSSIQDIALEKSGIIKKGVPFFTASADPQISRVFMDQCEEIGAIYHNSNEIDLEWKEGGDSFQLRAPFSSQKLNFRLKMKGAHQRENALLAMHVLFYLRKKGKLKITSRHIETGMNDAELEGRFEITGKGPFIIYDTAHNEAAIDSVVMNVKDNYTKDSVTVLFASMKDKPYAEMIEKLFPVVKRIVGTEMDNERSASLEEIEIERIHSDEQLNWFKEWLKSAKKEEILLITGSHQWVADAKKQFASLI